MNFFKNIFKVSIFASICAPFLALAQSTAININTNLPGPAPSAGISGFIINFYNFALLISGTLAFVMIVYAGVRYALAAGNPAKQSDARGMITSALLGLLLLAGAYVILYTINPNILNLQIPNLPELSGVPAAPVNGIGTTGGAGIVPSGPPGARCIAPSSGGCSVTNLANNGGSCFGNNISLAAGVCNVESANGSFVYSTTDKCDDGSVVSFGLFQINISANSIGGLNCPSAFSNPYKGSNPHCTVTNRALYTQCVAAALNQANNVAAACSISRGGTSFSQWGPATRQACGLP